MTDGFEDLGGFGSEHCNALLLRGGNRQVKLRTMKSATVAGTRGRWGSALFLLWVVANTPTAGAAFPAVSFQVSLGTQYTVYPAAVQVLIEQERKFYALVPLRFEGGVSLRFLPQLLTGLVFRFDMEGNFNPLPPGGARNYATGSVAVSGRYIFPVVMGDGLAGPFVRLDLGMAGLGTAHAAFPGLAFAFETLVGVGYSIPLLENKSAVLLDLNYLPRFFVQDVAHSLGFTVGVLF